MPRPSAERVADRLWRRVRPLIVDLIGEVMTEPEPIADEDSYIAARAAKQLERLRTHARHPRQGQGERRPAATPKLKAQ